MVSSPKNKKKSVIELLTRP